MVESFGGIINLVIFVILTLGWAYYAFQMLVGTASFFDRFNISHTGIIMGRFVGSFAESFAGCSAGTLAVSFAGSFL